MNNQDRNIIKVIHEIISRKIAIELKEMHEAYDLPKEILDTIHATLYIKSNNTQSWKGGNTKFVKIFETECKLLLKHKRIDFRELGFLTFLAITFTNFEDNTLRSSDGTSCTQKDIIAESGMSRSVISSMIRDLVKKRLLFERKSHAVPTGKSYFLNPMLFYRGSKMENRQADILKNIKDEIYSVWKNKDEAEAVIKNHNETIERAVEDIIIVEQEIINDFYNQAMGIDRTPLNFESLKNGIREGLSEENLLQ